MSKRHRAPSQRQLRVGELIRHALAEVLARGNIQDPVLAEAGVTVVEVRMSPDLRQATAYVMPLGGRDADAVLAALARAARYLRGQVSRLVELKYMPEIGFRLDTSFEASDRIERLLREPRVARDLAGEGPGEDGGAAPADPAAKP